MSTEEKNAQAPDTKAQEAEAAQEEEAYAADLSEQRKVRRQKLKDLVDAGRNPYLHETWDVTIHSQEIKDRF
ncbi:MAG: hypothetical protein ACI4LM_03790, partial [Anaerovoracaceae bacterium]